MTVEKGVGKKTHQQNTTTKLVNIAKTYLPPAFQMQ